MECNRFTALSFRNSEEFSHLDWHMKSRNAPLRNRRDVRVERLSNIAQTRKIRESNLNLSKNLTLSSAASDNLVNASDTKIQRSKRDMPECVSNYNSVRQLLIGCSQTNVIEVRPQCNEEGDEGLHTNCSNFFSSLFCVLN